VYHYNWGHQFDNGGTGLYQFKVTGPGDELEWDAELFCKTK
jgi:hypothetical protein